MTNKIPKSRALNRLIYLGEISKNKIENKKEDEIYKAEEFKSSSPSKVTTSCIFSHLFFFVLHRQGFRPSLSNISIL